VNQPRTRRGVAIIVAAGTLVVAAFASCIAFLPGAPCHHDDDCRSGNRCDVAHGYCVAAPVADAGNTPGDAGNPSADAGDVDAGIVDAGIVDAGTDVDAGNIVDAGDVDAGASDAGAADAGTFCALQPPVCVPVDDARVIPANSPANAVVTALGNGPGQLSPGPGKVVIVSVSSSNTPYTAPGPLNNGGTIIVTSNDNAAFNATGGDAFHAKDNTTLILDGITVTGATAGGAPGFLAKAEGAACVVDVRHSVFGPSGNTVGLDVKSGARLSFRQSIVGGVGGIGLEAEGSGDVLTIENSVVVNNGGGGVNLANGNDLEMTFATVANNSAGGVVCGTPVTGNLQASLISGNSGTSVSLTCPTLVQTRVDPGNPDFVGVGADSLAHQFRIKSTSACVDFVSQGTDQLPSIDFDGAPRPVPAGGSDDCGAFEVQP
jgi:hypothetical protein